MAVPVLALRNICTSVSDTFHLKDISLDLFEGEVHALMGENGSGKTSLVRIIMGSDTLDAGEILLDGNVVYITSPLQATRLGISVIHQETTLFDQFSIAENVFFNHPDYYGKSLGTVRRDEMLSDCQRILNQLGIPWTANTPVKKLNIAQRQLLEIVRCHVSHARVVIMDEPTSSLTDSEVEILFRIIRDLKSKKVAILYITHKIEEIRQIGDRISIIRDGRMIATQQISETDNKEIIHLMTGMDFNERYPKLRVRTGQEVVRVSGLSSGNILKDINFTLHRREVLGVIGLVGSGRTKLARALFGIEKPDAGEIRLDGKPLSLKSPKDAINAGFGYVTEDRMDEGLMMCLDIGTNITIPSLAQLLVHHAIDTDKENDLVTRQTNRLAIKADSIRGRVSTLSGGNQQKVVLGKWIMSNARIFILDEPTKGIDIAAKVDVYNVMNELVMKGASLILISSDVDEVIGMCDRVLVLYNGRVQASIPHSEATREKILYHATGGV